MHYTLVEKQPLKETIIVITRINPDTLHRNPAFSQVITVEPGAKTVYIGGQNAVNVAGEIVGDDLATQTEQTIENIIAALAAVGATSADIVKMTIYIVEGQDLREGYAVVGRYAAFGENPAAITVVIVAGLAHPEYLVEIDAVAAISGE